MPKKVMNKTSMSCTKCKDEYKLDTQQSICIEYYGLCMNCLHCRYLLYDASNKIKFIHDIATGKIDLKKDNPL